MEVMVHTRIAAPFMAGLAAAFLLVECNEPFFRANHDVRVPGRPSLQPSSQPSLQHGLTPDWTAGWINETGQVAPQQDAQLQRGGSQGKFNDYCCTGTNPELFAIAPSTGLGFPAAINTVIRIDGNVTQGRKVFAAADQQPFAGGQAPNVGELQFYRWYYRNSVGTGIESGGAHVIESHVGYIAWAFKPLDMQADGTYKVRLWLNRTNSYQDFWESQVSFKKDAAYRWELSLVRSDATHFRVNGVRVYGADDATLVADATQFVNVADKATLSAENPTMPIHSLAQDLQSIDVGQPNQTGSVWKPGNYMYVGKMAIRRSASSKDWIGKYPAGSEN